MSDSRLETSIAFYNIEAHLFRAGKLAYFRMLRTTMRTTLQIEGAFGPFSLRIRRGDGVTVPHVFKMWEAY